MDPSPPRNRRLRRPNGTAGASSSVSSTEYPILVPKTPAQIVSEAKEELQWRQNRDRARAVPTNRPFTPLEGDRNLFGQTASNYTDRPPSAFSLGSQHFDGPESRPVSGTNRPPSGSMRPPSGSVRPPSGRLAPIDDSAYEGVVPKPPSGDPKKRRSARKLRPQASLEVDQSQSTPRSGSCGDLKGHDTEVVGSRRVHSGPKERTSPHSETPGSASSSHRTGSGGAVRSGSGGVTRSGSGSAGSRSQHSHPTSSAVPAAAPPVEVIRRAAEVISIEERGEGDGQEVPSPTRSSGGSSKHHTDKERAQNSEYVESAVQPLIDLLRQPNVEDDIISSTCDEIYEKLDSVHLLGKASGKRSSILKSIFKLMDRSSPKVLLSLARLTLALRVSGNNLNGVCKLVFKVSKDKSNDQLFTDSNILDLLFDTMVNMDHDQSGEALVYCCGAVKFLAGNKALSDTLSRKCTLYTLASILNKINKQSIDTSKVKEKHVQVLVQLTSALRRFAEIDSFTSQFISHSIIDELCVTSIAFSSEYELMLNVSSAFSKLTVQSAGCDALSKHPSCYKSLLKLLSIYTHKEDLVTRICFVLGNLAALDEESRLALYQEKDSMQALMNVFEHYLQLSFKDSGGPDGSTSSRQSVTEVLIKLIRVIANLSISEDVGSNLCDNKKCVEYLLHIIDVKDIVREEELVLNSMATVNNLSFYSSPGTAIEDNEVETSRCLMKLLLKDHKEGLLESCRIYGNLTRSRLVRDFLASNSVLEIMVTLLDSGDQELVYSCCGVLVNFMCDEDKRPVLKRENGIAKLVEVLNDFSVMDWQLAGLVCQVLWNYSTNIRSSNQTFGEQESQALITLLNDYIDDAHIPRDGSCSSEMRHYLHDTWRSDFCSVAAQLRKRIKSHQSKFVELSPPRDGS